MQPICLRRARCCGDNIRRRTPPQSPRATLCVAIAVALCWLAASVLAKAQPLCSTLPGKRLILKIGDTQSRLIKTLGRGLASEAQLPVGERLRLLYVTSGSCTNVDAVYSGTKVIESLFYLPTPEEDPEFDPNSAAAPTCINDYNDNGTPGADIDVGISATFVSSCQIPASPLNVRVFSGPVQAYLWVVPRQSNAQALAFTEGYFAFGFGNDSGLENWNNEALFHIRPQSKSSILTPAAAIGVPAGRWQGMRWDKSTEVLSAVIADGQRDPEGTIGILGAQIYDNNRQSVQALAFRAREQWYAYYPDSTATARDKRNVRDGHYTPWSPIEAMLIYDAATQQARNPDAQYLVDLLLSRPVAQAPQGFAAIDHVIDTGMVPLCAMQVQREFEGGDLQPATPPEPCGCYYEARVQSPSPECIACDTSTPCAVGRCSFGFCEDA